MKTKINFVFKTVFKTNSKSILFLKRFSKRIQNLFGFYSKAETNARAHILVIQQKVKHCQITVSVCIYRKATTGNRKQQTHGTESKYSKGDVHILRNTLRHMIVIQRPTN